MGRSVMGSSSTLALLMPRAVSAWTATLLWWVVAMAHDPIATTRFRTAFAMAEPSSGSVLAPSSSNSARDRGVAWRSTAARL